jgi:hypothetical protein
MKRLPVFITVSALAFTLFMWLGSCTHDSILPADAEICFERDVLPVFLNSCAISGCHDGSGESDLVLTNYVAISHALEPGNPDNSEVYKAITSRWGENRMPPSGPLPLETRMLIRLWIEQGAPQSICPEEGGDPNFVNQRACFTRDVLPVLVSGCALANCHDVITHEEGYTFTSYSSTMLAVKPGNPSGSKLVEVITETDPGDVMPPPPYNRLSQSAVDSIKAWISYGALNEYCGEECDTLSTVTFSGVIWPLAEKSCKGCHSGASPSGGVSITGYQDLKNLASSGSLIKALNGAGVPKMPPAGSFSQCRIRQFELWVTDGALNN